MALTLPLHQNAKPMAKPYSSPTETPTLLINPNGSKLWRLRYRFAGTQKNDRARGVPDVPLSAGARQCHERAQARRRAQSSQLVLRAIAVVRRTARIADIRIKERVIELRHESMSVGSRPSIDLGTIVDSRSNSSGGQRS